MTTRSEDIERDIEETRRGMSRTMAEIERRLHPDSLIDTAVSWVKGSSRGRAVMDQVTDVVARNPLPVVLIGIGLAWLAWEVARPQHPRHLSRYEPMRRRMGPDPRPERYHTHVEDGGGTARPDRGPTADEIIGQRHNPTRARDAARAFEEAERAMEEDEEDLLRDDTGSPTTTRGSAAGGTGALGSTATGGGVGATDVDRRSAGSGI